MAILALKGHSTRGKELIEILEMLGGKNLNNLDGASNMYYLIGLIVPKILGTSKLELDKTHVQFQFTYFTLENFLEKYPYKVGDRVTYRADKLLETQVITNMRWDSNYDCVLYYLDNCNIIKVEDILYKIGSSEDNIPTIQDKITVETMEDKDMDSKNYGTATIKYIQEDGSRDMELIIPYNQEIVNIDGRYILRDKKPQYPKTYAECCRVLGISDGEFMFAGLSDDEYNLFDNFVMLKRCRDAYWKIAGEQMGLGQPWVYDMSKDEFSCAISYQYGSIKKCEVRYKNHFIAFPTKEMRDEFYKNFKDLIESCKELL